MIVLAALSAGAGGGGKGYAANRRPGPGPACSCRDRGRESWGQQFPQTASSQVIDVKGPYPIEAKSDANIDVPWPRDIGRVVRGKWYRVTKSFVDADGDTHAVGEEWQFIKSTFFPYDEDHFLFVRLRGNPDSEWRIRLGSRNDIPSESEIIENFDDYVRPID